MCAAVSGGSGQSDAVARRGGIRTPGDGPRRGLKRACGEGVCVVCVRVGAMHLKYCISFTFFRDTYFHCLTVRVGEAWYAPAGSAAAERASSQPTRMRIHTDYTT